MKFKITICTKYLLIYHSCAFTRVKCLKKFCRVKESATFYVYLYDRVDYLWKFGWVSVHISVDMI